MKSNNNIKKILVYFLALIMVLTIAPMAALAEEVPLEENNQGVIVVQEEEEPDAVTLLEDPEYPALQLDTEIQVSSDGEPVVYSFTPEHDGFYRVYSYDSEGCDPMVYMYPDAECSVSEQESDDDGDESNFSLEVTLDGGETKYLQMTTYSGNEPFSYKVKAVLRKSTPVTYYANSSEAWFEEHRWNPETGENDTIKKDSEEEDAFIGDSVGTEDHGLVYDINEMSFEGWSEDPNAAEPDENLCFTEEMKLYAVWRDNVKISLDQSIATLTEKETLTLQATITPENASQAVIWTSSNESVATVDAAGKVTALNAGTAVITATATADETREATCTITVTHATLEKVNAKAATCTEAGNKEYWTCSGCGKFFADAQGKTEIEKDDWFIAAKGHVPKDPEIENEIKPTDETEGSYDEYIYCDVCGELISQRTVTVPKINKDALKASIATASTAAAQATVSADGEDVDSTEKWVPQEAVDNLNTAIAAAQAVVDTKDAPQADVDAAVTALNEALAVFESAKQDGKSIPLKSFVLNRTSVEMAALGSLQLEVTYHPANTTEKELTWSSSDPVIATVDRNGKITALKRGTATITATSKANSKKTAKCVVTVKFADAYYNLDGSGKSNVTKEMETAINWAADKKITGEDVNFGTKSSMTRGQFVRFLYRYAGNPNVTNAMIKKYGAQFADVDKNYTHYKAIVWAVSKGLIAGYSDGSFKPNGTLTRNNVATILWKYAGSPKVSNPMKPFSDVAKSSALAWGKSKKIFTGKKFYPKNNCLRGDFAVFLYRYDKNVK